MHVRVRQNGVYLKWIVTQMREHYEILDDIHADITPRDSFGIRYLLGVLLIISIVFLVLFPKVYLQSQIYYKSRDIAVLKREYDALKEENKIIKSKVETIRFKNQVLDTLF